MIVYLRDGSLTLGYGRTVDEAAREAARMNLICGSAPFTVEEVKALIDVGAIQVREVRSAADMGPRFGGKSVVSKEYRL